MSQGCRGGVAGLCVGLVLAVSLPAIASADSPSWNGDYEITFIVGPKYGTSMAAGQPEGQYTDVYAFSSTCASDECTATITNGPPPKNPTVPQAIQFTWDGSSWTQASDFEWDCLMPDGTIQWNPARADVRYTPQADGSLSGTLKTEILSGACQGTVEIQTTAEPIYRPAERFPAEQPT